MIGKRFITPIFYPQFVVECRLPATSAIAKLAEEKRGTIFCAVPLRESYLTPVPSAFTQDEVYRALTRDLNRPPTAMLPCLQVLKKMLDITQYNPLTKELLVVVKGADK